MAASRITLLVDGRPVTVNEVSNISRINNDKVIIIIINDNNNNYFICA